MTPRLNGRRSNYDKFPSIAVPALFTNHCWRGWEAIAAQLRDAAARTDRRGAIIAVECYPGVNDDAVRNELAALLRPALALDAKDAFKTEAEIDLLVAPDLGGNDPVFGRLSPLRLEEFLDEARVQTLRKRLEHAATQGLVLIVGPAASVVATDPAVFVYADMPRWEGQLRQRRNEVPNLGADNHALKASLKYKRSFFVDWRVCDRWKRRTMTRWDFLLDTTRPESAHLITGKAHLAALHATTTRPFRVVPFFDPGPWGGQWMKEVCDLDRSAKNYAWCFDCVPEENSLLLGFGDERVEIPALNLVFAQPEALLGEAVYGRFGAEFPIRFDFLDTIGGGNLSFQVHPSSDYIAENFGMRYTQDESYYILDAQPDAKVYLGRRSDAGFDEMIAALATAQRGGTPFDAERFVASAPARPHDHFLLPARTLRCSGAGCMVLEVSATPYIFTFKLWDWGRVGLDGMPRPIHLEHGKNVIRWERDEAYARSRLINRVELIAKGAHWREERTGLHEAEFIETRRHWFRETVPHDTRGGVNVLNLVQGEAALVESSLGAFAPFEVHYAETFIVPAAVGPYTIRPLDRAGDEHATLKAFVRTHP